MDREISKPGHAQPGFPKNLPHTQLVAASFDRGGMVIRDSEPSSGVGGGNSRTVAEGENSVHILAAKRLHHGVRGHLRIFEMYRDGAVAPGIFQLMAAIGDVNELYAQLERRFFKTSRLVTELPGEEQQSFGWRGHVGGVSAPESHKALGCYLHIFQLWFHAADRNQLIPRRFRVAIPRFAEIRNNMFRMFRSGDGRSRESGRGVRSLPDAFERCRPC